MARSIPLEKMMDAATIAEVQRLVRAHVPQRDPLVDALIAERREEEKIQHAKYMADERILLEER